MSLADQATALERALHERFGLERFRPGQREVIEQVLRGRDVLCVMPTGGGKSLCYQLPALLIDGLTLVVSPLIALMKDQVDALQQRGIRATLINSSLDPAEQRARIEEAEAGRYDLLYVAPERFRSPRFLEAMTRARPALLAVDEAHCISEWGHDFRPDYSRIGLARRKLGSPPCIALTATATDLVRRDIADQLDLRDPSQFVTGFDRPNLTYSVFTAGKDAHKLSTLAEVLDQNPGSSIIYSSSRARCEMIAQFIEKELRRNAVIYHAGLPRDERALAQEQFMRGAAEVVVATNAFGMGVDKPDIRSVIHFNMPGTLEAYYQEAGRAGRDGLAAECVLLFAQSDRFLQELFIENEYPPAAAVYQVYNYLRSLDADPIELTHAEIRVASGIDLNEQAVGTTLKILEGAGAIEKFLPRENMAIVRINAEPDEPSLVSRLSAQANVQRIVLLGLEGLVNRRYSEPVYFHPHEFASALGIDRPALARAIRALTAELPIDYVPPFRGNAIRVLDRARRPTELEIDFATLEKRKRREYDKLDRMMKYSQTSQCRRSFILGYFGDSTAAQLHCGHCDNCGATSGTGGAGLELIESKEGREVILKVLSGVARAKGRFGKTMVAQMLTGSGSEKMDRWGLKKLSTFGILAQFRKPELTQIIDALTSAGFVECPEVDRFRPIVNLTARGWELVKGFWNGPIALGLPPELAAKVRLGGLERRVSSETTAAPSIAPAAPRTLPADEAQNVLSEMFSSAESVEGDPLFERLKGMRAVWAREGNMPAYSVFNNKTLQDLVRLRPQTPQALLNIKGLGPARVERYGSAILKAIADGKAPETEPRPAPGTGALSRSEPQPLTTQAASLAPAASPRESLVPTQRHGEWQPLTPPLHGGPLPQGERAVIVPSPSIGEHANTSPLAGEVAPRRGADEEFQASTPGSVDTNARKPGESYVLTEEWTWRLLDRGFTLDEAAAIRGLDQSAVIRHALSMARQGRPISPSAFLSPEVLEKWTAWHTSHGPATPPPSLGGNEAFWSLFLACRPSR